MLLNWHFSSFLLVIYPKEEMDALLELKHPPLFVHMFLLWSPAYSIAVQMIKPSLHMQHNLHGR